MHFDDLTEYLYLDCDDLFYNPTVPTEYCLVFPAVYKRLNVGWLERGHPYEMGPVPAELVGTLADITAIQQVNPRLGIHECDLCDEPQRLPLLGTSEIRIPGHHDVVYAAPNLIVHYVAAHGYRPPAEFIAAVLAVDAGRWVGLRWKVDGHELAIAFPWLADGVSVLDPDDPDTWPSHMY
ncbi:hypothetical protein ABGB12_11920 [Actinocorallia sp. B10E7]|uniref:DUF7919 family protein n=1 Tax=Actinocorallia sp. B10E7 TaxID=3153558 RepID=UPI00325F55D4